jgi:hypothetical protein
MSWEQVTYPLDFEAWVKQEASAIGTDGCSKVTNFHGFCCLVHDLEFYYARSVHSAYKLYRMGIAYPWTSPDCAEVTFKQANEGIKRCIIARSKMGMWSPVAWWRYWGTQKGAKGAWEQHRERERKAAELVVGV